MSTTPDDALAELTAPGGPFEIREQDVLGVRMRAYAAGPRTLADVLAGTAAHGERDYLVYEQERYSYAEHLDLVAGLAHELAERWGVRQGDRVAIAMRNYPEFAFFFWAAQALGAIAVPLNAWWTGPELRHGLEDSGAVLLVADDERLERTAPYLAGAESLRGVVSVRSSRQVPGVLPWAELRAALPRGLALPAAELAADDVATILYTSGTTAHPRGAVHSHRNHVTNLLNSSLLAAVAAAAAADPASGNDSAPAQPGALATMPLFHITQLASLYLAAAAGSKLVLMYKWDAERALELVERERLTSFGGVPMQVQAVLDSPSLAARDLSSLRMIGLGATAIPPEKVLRIQRAFGGSVTAGTGYGMTEATSAITYLSGAEYVAHPDSVGRPTPVNDLRIVGEDGADVPPGEVGELWVRGPNIVRGYWGRPEETAAAFVEGWHRSGDVARIGPDGLVRLVDRIKDVVIRAGENVYCGEVEAVLYEHPAVHTVAVIGLPHPVLGEEVSAVVRLREGAGTTAEELQAHVAARLAAFKVPSRIVFTAEDVPRTPTGKIMKREIRDQVLRAAGSARA